LEEGLTEYALQQNWYEFVEDIKQKLNELNQLEKDLIEYDFALPDVDEEQFKNDLLIMKDRFQKGEPNALFWMTGGRKIKYLKTQPILDGRIIRSIADIELIEKAIRRNEQKRKITRIWNRTLEKVNGPTFEKSNPRFVVELNQILTQIEAVLSLMEKILALKKFMNQKEVKVGFSFSWFQFESYQNLKQLSDMLKTRLEFNELRQHFSQTQKVLEQISRKEKIHPIIKQFRSAFAEKDPESWEALHHRVQSLSSTQRQVIQFFELIEKLATKAPLLAEDIKTSIDQDWAFPQDYRDAWKFRQLDTLLARLDRYRPDKLQNEIHQLQREESRLIEHIVANSTWKQQIERITEPQKRSLQAWKRHIKRIGKGTGRHAPWYRKQARQEMKTAMGAIPVWIMPINRVLENFSVEQEKFDVVIVDESSQCDIFSLQVILRAEKAVVVGDDEQISPAAVGVDQDKVKELIRRYLQGIPRKEMFDMKTSLYELSDQIFPKNARLMLKEHFRSVPEIIQFSNDLSYDGRIVPLRLPTPNERLDPPVLTKFVEEGYREDSNKQLNIPEAEAIVEDIKKMVEDPNFVDQTMGVISLQGDHQARWIENALLEEVGEEEMVKRRLVCGDAYAFQGDERDIMFLSMVVAQNKRFQALTAGSARQRFNVAASRAKNQSRLYHSIRLEDLNPMDMRYRLLSYYQHPSRTVEEYENVADKLESPLERDVARRIISRGYRVTPQLWVGGKYRIDMVVEGMDQRLAVECDGDRWHGIDRWIQDKERQYVLERVGWTFWRVRGSEFYRNPEKAMKSLWDILDEMGIQPEAFDKVLTN
jgi:very-short-patch-repair endonuclease